MQPGAVLRVARSTDHLTTIAEMYAKGLDFTVLAEFHDHDGFDGIILGHPQQPYHLEFTTQRGHHVGRAPTQDHLLVFYLPNQAEWEASCARMLAAGFQRVPSYNPYWEAQGQTFEDLDGYRVMLQNAAWTIEGKPRHTMGLQPTAYCHASLEQSFHLQRVMHEGLSLEYQHKLAYLSEYYRTPRPH